MLKKVAIFEKKTILQIRTEEIRICILKKMLTIEYEEIVNRFYVKFNWLGL